jgi:phage shock protein C
MLIYLKHETESFVSTIIKASKIRSEILNMPAKLRKSRTDKMVAGVCGGIGEYLKWDPTIVRIIFLILVFSSFGTMVLIYFILALIMPD